MVVADQRSAAVRVGTDHCDRKLAAVVAPVHLSVVAPFYI